MSTGTIVVIAINLLWFVPFLYFMIRMARRAGRSRDHRRRLLESGSPASAVILEVKESGPYYGRVPHLDFRLRVTPGGEPPFEAGARGFFRQLDLPRFQVGSTVEVRFDPSDRTTVAIVGDTLA